MAIDGTMATRAVTPAGLAAPSAGRARSSRARNLAIPNATSATATRREVSQQVTYRVDIPIMALSRLDAREASMRYRDDLMAGREESMEESTAVKVIASAEEESESKKEETPEVESEPKVDRWASLMDPRGQADPISAANIGLDPRAGGAPVDGAEGGAGAGNDDPAAGCPVCKGTGWKPCGQCGGTGVNQEDLFGGKFTKGDTCWLCSGKKKTMCGNCVDLTDSF